MIKKLIYTGIITIFFVSCKKDFGFVDSISASPEYSIPLGNYNFNANNEFEKLRNLVDPVSILDSILYNNDTLLSTQELVINSDVPFNLATIPEQYDNIDLVELSLRFINGYPTGFDAQINFYDAQGMPMYTYPPDSPVFIEGAKTGEDGEVIQPSVSDLIATFPRNVVDNLDQLNSFTININLETQSSKFDQVKFYDYQKITLYIGATVEVEVEVNY